MADITLADYAGYIFREVIKAREMADAYSRQVAQTYSQDPVLQHFSVPRFKVPKMNLTVPVLISGARFSQTVVFKVEEKVFISSVLGRVNEAMATVAGRTRAVLGSVVLPVPILVRTAKSARTTAAGPQSLEQLAQVLFQALRANPDPTQPAAIVDEAWSRIFNKALVERNLQEVYKKFNPNNELFNQSLADLMGFVKNNTVVDRTTIQSLLINPETNVVKNGSSDSSVFTISAELLEEGFFIKTVKDETSGQTRSVVEFE